MRPLPDITMQPDHDHFFSRSLKLNMDRYEASAQLRRRIVASLEHEQPDWMSRASKFAQYLNVQWRSLTAAAAFGMAATLLGTNLLTITAGDDILLQQVTASHIRALMADHLIDVVSSDQHTVKPWFAGKIDYSPGVSDYAKEGFELAGGRLDYVSDRVVATLVYKRGLHVIDAFVWPATGPNTSPARRSRQGINGVEWTGDGMKYYLVSDIAYADLDELARLLRVRSVE